jgi:hypothetical protein
MKRGFLVIGRTHEMPKPTPAALWAKLQAPRFIARRLLVAATLAVVLAGCGRVGGGQSGDGDARRPVISSFAATPATLAAGGGTTTLAWSVTGATGLAIDHDIGAVSGSSRTVDLTTTTTYTLTATNAAGNTTTSATVYVDTGATGWSPLDMLTLHAGMVSPQDGETLVTSASGVVDLRLVASARDAANYASQIQFMVDTDPTPLLTVRDSDGGDTAGALDSSADYNVLRGFARRALTPGTHSIFARATVGGKTITSPPVVITVESPVYAQTRTLTADVTNLASAGLATLSGTPSARIRVEGAGHTLSDSSAVDWRYVDFYNVGSAATPNATSLSVSASSGTLSVLGCRFFYSNPSSFVANGTASANLRDNTWASNNRQLAGQYPADVGPRAAVQAVTIGGASSAAKAFAGNNIGAGYVRIAYASKGWTLGGDTDADSNVFIGPRIGFYFENGVTNTLVKGNYSHFPYWGGWSMAGNFEINDAAVIVEHNVIALSSWPVRGVNTTFRYNLVIANNEGGIWTSGDTTNAFIHHNLIVGNSSDRGGLYIPYSGTSVRAYNNTYDFLFGTSGTAAVEALQDAVNTVDLKSNIFANLNGISLAEPGLVNLNNGKMSADYNQFWNTGARPHYTATPPGAFTGTPGAHDSSADPRFVNKPTQYFYWTLRDVWVRTKTVSQIRADYRARYTPQSPLPGDPSVFGEGNVIGAIGATGAAAAADLFGK